MDPSSQKPLPSKRYYDIATWLVTQLVFSFAVAPFYLLDFSDSIKVWTRVYFYAIVVTGAGIAFFASPGKKWLRAKIEARTQDAGVNVPRSISTDSLTAAGEQKDRFVGPGVTEDLPREMDDIIEELKAEVGKAHNGNKPLKDLVAEKVNEMSAKAKAS